MPKLTAIDYNPFSSRSEQPGLKLKPVDFNPFESGNIDLNNRPIVKNADGSISTVRSMGINVDGKETLIPTVSDDGKILTPDEAIAQFRRTGRHLGKFGTIDEANLYAQKLHRDQEMMYDNGSDYPMDIKSIMEDRVRIILSDGTSSGLPRFVGRAEKAAITKFVVPEIKEQIAHGDPLGLRGE